MTVWSANSILSTNKHDLNKYRSGIRKKYRSLFPPLSFVKLKIIAFLTGVY